MKEPVVYPDTAPLSLKRISVIDAIRGIVLIGICMVHGLQHFAGAPMLEEAPYPWVATMDGAMLWFIRYFIMGKFFIIFSFLFGLSFFIQMDRAAQKGFDFRGRFLWRLLLLFIIGFLHSAMCRVDILIVYAVLGVPLALMYRLSTKVLIGISLFFVLGGVQLTTVGYEAIFKPVKTEKSEEYYALQTEKRQRAREIVLTGSVAENIQINVSEHLKSKFDSQFGAYGRGFMTMGLFVLGLLVGRIRLFENLEHYRSRLYYIGGAALLLLLALYVLKPYIPWGSSFLNWFSIQIGNWINLLTAYVWVVVIIGLYQLAGVQKVLTKVVSYGQMGLTNYIVQSVVGVCIFFGFGLGLQTKIGAFFSVLVCLGYTILQIQASYYWLKKFRYGPIEWLWRSGTYLKWQPFHKGRV